MATLPYTTYKILLFQRQAPSLLSAHFPALLVANIAMIVLLVGLLLLVTSAHLQLRQGRSRGRPEAPPSTPPTSKPKSRSSRSPRPRTESPVESATATGLQLVEIGPESPLQSRLPIGAVVESVNGTPATSLAAAESVLKPGVNELDWLDDAGKRNMAYVMVRDGKLHAEFRPV